MAGIVVRWGSDLARSTTEAGGRLTCLIPPLLPAGAIRDSAFRSPGRSGLKSPRPRECRTLHVQRFAGNFLDGASRTRTGGLLGAIRAIKSARIVSICRTFSERGPGAGHSRITYICRRFTGVKARETTLWPKRASVPKCRVLSDPLLANQEVRAADEVTFASAPFRAKRHYWRTSSRVPHPWEGDTLDR